MFHGEELSYTLMVLMLWLFMYRYVNYHMLPCEYENYIDLPQCWLWRHWISLPCFFASCCKTQQNDSVFLWFYAQLFGCTESSWGIVKLYPLSHSLKTSFLGWPTCQSSEAAFTLSGIVFYGVKWLAKN